jgi:hypothetical protein
MDIVVVPHGVATSVVRRRRRQLLPAQLHRHLAGGQVKGKPAPEDHLRPDLGVAGVLLTAGPVQRGVSEFPDADDLHDVFRVHFHA